VRLKELGKVVSLFKDFLLARTMNKDQRTLVAITNYTLSVNWSSMAAIKLVLDTSGVRSFVLVSRHSLLDCLTPY